MTEASLAQQGYQHYYDMLADKIRMQAYRDAIFKTVRKGDVVVDLGAGTGLLGVWALQAGAARVYVIEKTNAIELAKEIAKVNQCLDKMIFLNENSADVELPEKADVLVSETLGSFGIDENTLLFTIDARQRFLKDGGVMIPQAVEIFVAPVNDQVVYEKIDFWRHIPGIDFSPAFELFSKKIMVESINEKGLLAEPVSIGLLDLITTTEKTFQAGRYIPITKKGDIHGVAGWFKVRLCAGIEINTSPAQPQTHWKQAFFPFEHPVSVINGDVLDWKVSVAEKDLNSDDTCIHYEYRCTQLINEYPLRPSDVPKVPDVTEPGRNQMCGCGSGKKYKKCCLLKK